MKYVAKPVEVEAYRIISAEYREVSARCGDVSLLLESGERVVATEEMCARMTPAPGDYWVIQPDGYVYLNPKAVFERKYEAVATTA